MSELIHGVHTKLARDKLIDWAGETWTSGPESIDVRIFDLAGVSLVGAFALAERSTMGGVPPSRAVRIFRTGVLGAIEAEGGRARLSGFADTVNAYMINDVAKRTFPRYRKLATSAFAKLYAAGYAPKGDVEEWVLKYVPAGLGEVGQILGPQEYPGGSTKLGSLIKDHDWFVRQQRRRAPLPERDELGMWQLWNGTFDQFLGLA
ncbi:hypothetical protein JCM4914_00810 [Streptomyces platensis subsp. malvinus]